MVDVSVIVPIYNSEEYLERCINSLTNQTLTNIEILLVNDGSTDLSRKIIHKFERQDERVQVIDLSINKGVSNARNVGIERAKGKYVQFIDSDDFIENHMLETLFAEAEKKKLDMCYYRFYVNGAQEDEYPGIKGEYTDLYIGKELLKVFTENKEFFLYPWMVFFRREFLNNKIIRFKNLKIGEGGEFNTRAIYYAERVSVINHKLYNYCINTKSATHTTGYKINILLGQIYQYISMLKILAIDLNSEELIIYLNYQKRKISGAIKKLTKSEQTFIYERLEDDFAKYIFKNISLEEMYLKDFSQDEIKIIRSAKSIMIYGVGYAANNVLELFNRYDVAIDGFIVSKLEEDSQTIMGHRIVAIDQIEEAEKDTLIVVSTNKKYHPAIKKELSKRGYTKVLYLNIVI